MNENNEILANLLGTFLSYLFPIASKVSGQPFINDEVSLNLSNYFKGQDFFSEYSITDISSCIILKKAKKFFLDFLNAAIGFYRNIPNAVYLKNVIAILREFYYENNIPTVGRSFQIYLRGSCLVVNGGEKLKKIFEALHYYGSMIRKFDKEFEGNILDRVLDDNKFEDHVKRWEKLWKEDKLLAILIYIAHKLSHGDAKGSKKLGTVIKGVKDHSYNPKLAGIVGGMLEAIEKLTEAVHGKPLRIDLREIVRDDLLDKKLDEYVDTINSQ